MSQFNPTTFSAYFFCFAFQCSLNLYFAQFSEIRTTFVNCVITEYKSTPKISLCSKIVELFALLSKTLVLLYYSYPDYIFIQDALLPDKLEPLFSDFYPTFRPQGAYSLRVSISTYLIFNPPDRSHFDISIIMDV